MHEKQEKKKACNGALRKCQYLANAEKNNIKRISNSGKRASVFIWLNQIKRIQIKKKLLNRVITLSLLCVNTQNSALIGLFTHSSVFCWKSSFYWMFSVRLFMPNTIKWFIRKKASQSGFDEVAATAAIAMMRHKKMMQHESRFLEILTPRTKTRWRVTLKWWIYFHRIDYCWSANWADSQ